ncbi:MAG: YciI family protein [Pseudomonadota bacterium]
MHVAIYNIDKPGHLPLRKETRQAHLDYLAETGVVVFGGPLSDAEGEMCGSMIVIDVENLAAAKAWAANDPYAKAGLFSVMHAYVWTRV